VKRTAIKITLNSKDVFDVVILDFLQDKKNKAGQLKKIVNDSIMLMQGKGIVKPGSVPEDLTPGAGAGEKEVTEKLSKMLNF